MARAGDEGWDAAIAAQRHRLTRLCVRLSGDPCAAEDLVQETLYEAWRLRGRQREVQPSAAWLSAIAGHVCRRWRRARGLELARRAAVPLNAETEGLGPADAVDVEAELDRTELVALLDRAMAELPWATRRILVERFVRDSPYAEIAGRLGLSQGAAAMRVQRGKLLLRRILTTRFRDQAAAFGLVDAVPPGAGWQHTRIWCPQCGDLRLWAQWAPGRRLRLECWGCGGHPRMVLMHACSGELYWGRTCADILDGVSGFKPAATRLMAVNHHVYRNGIAGLTARCAGCGRRVPVYVAPWGDVRTSCRTCGLDYGFSTIGGIAFSHPAAQAFWRRHGRIRGLPQHHVEAAGAAAIVCSLESRTHRSRLDIVLARDSLVVLGVHGAPPP